MYKLLFYVSSSPNCVVHIFCVLIYALYVMNAKLFYWRYSAVGSLEFKQDRVRIRSETESDGYQNGCADYQRLLLWTVSWLIRHQKCCYQPNIFAAESRFKLQWPFVCENKNCRIVPTMWKGNKLQMRHRQRNPSNNDAKEIHQQKQEQTKKSTKMMASISCNFSLSALPNINHTAVWLTGVGARNAIPSKKSKLPAQYWINLNVYSAWTTIKYWCFLCKHFKIWNWRIPSWLDKHHHHSAVAGEACENCLLVTWASALPAVSCQSLIYVAPWCFKWMGWDWVGLVGSPGGVNC